MQTAGQSHEAMFVGGLNCGGNVAEAKCAVKPVVWSNVVGPIFGGMGLAWVAQLVERVLGKDEVTGSIPVPGSRNLVGQSGEKFGAAPGGGNSTVESHSSKVMVAGSNPVPRSRY